MFLKSFYFMVVKSQDGVIKGSTLYHTIPTFNNPKKEAFWKQLWKKEKMLVTSIFSFLHNIFYPSWTKYEILSYNYIVICKYFQFRPVQNFVIWYRVDDKLTTWSWSSLLVCLACCCSSNFFRSYSISVASCLSASKISAKLERNERTF